MPKKTLKSLADIPPVEEPKPKAKTQEMPLEGEGVARKKIETIDKQADKVSSLCESRMATAENEREARAVLLGLLDQHGLTTYRLDDGRQVYVDDKRKAKIKSAYDEDDE